MFKSDSIYFQYSQRTGLCTGYPNIFIDWTEEPAFSKPKSCLRYVDDTSVNNNGFLNLSSIDIFIKITFTSILE